MEEILDLHTPLQQIDKQTIVNSTSGPDFGIVLPMSTSRSFLREKKVLNTSISNQTVSYIVVPFKVLLFILMTLKTFKILRLLLKGRSDCPFSWKKKKCLPLFIEVYIFGLSEIFLFV